MAPLDSHRLTHTMAPLDYSLPAVPNAGAGVTCAALLFVFYCCANAGLQYCYYLRRGGDAPSWKIQPARTEVLQRAHVPRLPLLNMCCTSLRRPAAAPWHFLLVSFNATLAVVFAGLTAELVLGGYSTLRFEPLSLFSAADVGRVFSEASVILLVHQAQEYYWHRLMHFPPVYRVLHKVHHAYKSPSPFDDMYIHPFEAFAYYMIMWSPPFIGHALYGIMGGVGWSAVTRAGAPSPTPTEAGLRLLLPGLLNPHLASFIAYVAVIGVAGILDHCGIRFSIPLLYDTADHDAHHEFFEVNYGFPFPLLDLLHGTYRGRLAGLTFVGKSGRLPLEWRSKAAAAVSAS